MHITDSRSSDKQGLDCLQMGIFGFVDGGDVVQLQVQKLVDGSQGALDFNIILQFHDNLLINKSLKKTEEQHLWMNSMSFLEVLVEVLVRKMVGERLVRYFVWCASLTASRASSSSHRLSQLMCEKSICVSEDRAICGIRMFFLISSKPFLSVKKLES